MRHVFSFSGGDKLTTMGASWFVSYCYYRIISPNHLNWNKVGTAPNRASVFDRTTDFHKYWLGEVLKMKDDNLNKNSLGLKAHEIKQMAGEVLKKM